jgi:hypothetical protein
VNDERRPEDAARPAPRTVPDLPDVRARVDAICESLEYGDAAEAQAIALDLRDDLAAE